MSRPLWRLAVARPRDSQAETVARHDAFLEMHDALFANEGRLAYHLWIRAERLALDVERFEADSRLDAVRDRVQGEVRGGVKAGVATTPSHFAVGERRASQLDLAALERLIQQPS
jgi:protein-disulfide isomerase